MSAEIQSPLRSGKSLFIQNSVAIDGGFYFKVQSESVHIPRADFLAAVEIECGVIIIDRADLPPVETSVPGFGPHYALVRDGKVHQSSFTYAYPSAPASSASWHRRTAEGHLALAEYLDAHPPVDEAQVEALASDLFAARWPGEQWDLRVNVQQDDYRTQARALLAAGWSK